LSLSRLQKSNSKYGNEHEAIAVYHMMRGVEKFCPIYTLCIGNAFGEAALLLAAGSKVRQWWQQQQQQQEIDDCVGGSIEAIVHAAVAVQAQQVLACLLVCTIAVQLQRLVLLRYCSPAGCSLLLLMLLVFLDSHQVQHAFMPSVQECCRASARHCAAAR
jgi:hypothetical protein